MICEYCQREVTGSRCGWCGAAPEAHKAVVFGPDESVFVPKHEHEWFASDLTRTLQCACGASMPDEAMLAQSRQAPMARDEANGGARGTVSVPTAREVK